MNAKLHESALELEAKDARLAEALKAKKKTKKTTSQSTTSPNKDKGIAELEGEVLRLRDREQALLDAVRWDTFMFIASTSHLLVLGGRAVVTKRRFNCEIERIHAA